MSFVANAAPFLPVLIFLGAIAFLVTSVVVMRLRHRREMQEFAARNGFDFLDYDVPRDLPESLTQPLSMFLRVKNCVSGRKDGERVVSFEYKRGIGRQSRWLWAVAVQRAYPDREVPALGRVEVERDGDWVLVYKYGLLNHYLNADDVMSLWEKLRTTEPKEVAAMQSARVSGDNVLIRPRHER